MLGLELFKALEPLKGQAVFHGSPHKCDVLEPRQCRVRNVHPRARQCGVYGAYYPTIALLYALIHQSKNTWRWECNLMASPEIRVLSRKEISSRPGYLYVLPKEPFETLTMGEVSCIAYEAVKPIDVFPVDASVLTHMQIFHHVRFQKPAGVL